MRAWMDEVDGADRGDVVDGRGGRDCSGMGAEQAVYWRACSCNGWSPDGQE